MSKHGKCCSCEKRPGEFSAITNVKNGKPVYEWFCTSCHENLTYQCESCNDDIEIEFYENKLGYKNKCPQCGDKIFLDQT